MKDSQNIIIGVLVVTAAILATTLAFTLYSRPAKADSSVSAGDYIIVTGAFNNTKDFVYVIDVPSRRMNVYEINRQKNAIDLLDGYELDRVFGAGR